MWKLMGRLDKLQYSCSDREGAERGEKWGGFSLQVQPQHEIRHGVPHCHLLQGKCSVNSHLKYRILWIYLLHGQPHNSLMLNCVLALQVQVRMTEGPRWVWNQEETSITGPSPSLHPLINWREIFSDPVCCMNPKASIRTECQSAYLALAAPWSTCPQTQGFHCYLSAVKGKLQLEFLGSSPGLTIDPVTEAKTTALLGNRESHPEKRQWLIIIHQVPTNLMILLL